MTIQPNTTAMAVIDPRRVPLAAQHFGEDRLDVLKQQIGRGWKRAMTDAELEHIATVCQRSRLDPLAKPAQIWFIQRFDKTLGDYVMTAQTGIDGLRTIANRSRDYLGQVGPQWCAEDGIWKDIWTSDKPPAAARVGVLRRGTREPMWSVAMWREWKGDTQFWREKPAHMLAKTAESIGLKRAAPAETNELEIAHNEELELLEVPARTAEYERIFGKDEEHAYAELPQAALNAGGDLVDVNSGEVLREKTEPEPEAKPEPPRMTPPADPRRGELLEMYGALLTQARHSGAIAEGDVSKWVLGRDISTVEIIARGRDLRALINRAQVDRSMAEPEATPATLDAKLVESIDDPLYSAYVQKVEDAVALGLEYTDIELPITVKELTKLGKALASTIAAARRDTETAAVVV